VGTCKGTTISVLGFFEIQTLEMRGKQGGCSGGVNLPLREYAFHEEVFSQEGKWATAGASSCLAPLLSSGLFRAKGQKGDFGNDQDCCPRADWMQKDLPRSFPVVERPREHNPSERGPFALSRACSFLLIQKGIDKVKGIVNWLSPGP
jgi:hypothetical protein